MARRKKYKQYEASGCRLCGDPSIGRGISKHVKDVHKIEYDAYTQCFGAGTILVDKLEKSGQTAQGRKKIMIHVSVRKFIVP
jgi:hypothetical protein